MMALNKSLQIQIWCVLVFVFGLNHEGTSALVLYGPSIHTLTNNQTDAIVENTINLSDYQPVYSVVVPLIPDKAFVNKADAKSLFQDFHLREFYVEAPPGYGIIAVIQILRLFTALGEESKCLDYIRFQELEGEDRVNPDLQIETPTKTSKSGKICGKVDQGDPNWQPKGLVGDRSFISRTNRLAVELLLISPLLHTEWTSSFDSNSANKRFEKVIAIEISFTAFPLNPKLTFPFLSLSTFAEQQGNISINLQPKISCQFDSNSSQNANEEVDYDENENSTSTDAPQLLSPLRPCLDFIVEDTVFCIHENLFCDEIIQCGYPTQFAHDEHSCPSKSVNNLEKNEKYLPNFGGSSSANETRLNPQLNKVEEPSEIESIKGLILVIAYLAGIVWVICVVWWIARRWLMCKHKGAIDVSTATADLDGTLYRRNTQGLTSLQFAKTV